MKKPDHDCGEACRELSEKQRVFHLAILGGRTQAEAHIEAGYKGGKERDSAAGQVYRNLQMQAALEHHREAEAVRYSKTKERSIERLAALAEHASMGNFARIKNGAIEIDDTDGKTADQLRGVGTLKDGKYGVEITVRDPVAAEKALAALGGWNAPVKIALDDASAKYNQMIAAGAAGDGWATECALEADIGDPATFGTNALAAYQKWQAGRPE